MIARGLAGRLAVLEAEHGVGAWVPWVGRPAREWPAAAWWSLIAAVDRGEPAALRAEAAFTAEELEAVAAGMERP